MSDPTSEEQQQEGIKCFTFENEPIPVGTWLRVLETNGSWITLGVAETVSEHQVQEMVDIADLILQQAERIERGLSAGLQPIPE